MSKRTNSNFCSNKCYQKSYRAKNALKIKKQIIDWENSHREEVRLNKAAYRRAHKSKIAEQHQAFIDKDPEAYRTYMRQYAKKRYASDIDFKLRTVLRARLNLAVKGNYKDGSSVEDLGCTIEELKKYLESKFLPGMSWDNWSQDGWHIDHIKPLSLFDLSDSAQLKEACHFSNLQPLWSKDNLQKGDRYNLFDFNNPGEKIK